MHRDLMCLMTLMAFSMFSVIFWTYNVVSHTTKIRKDWGDLNIKWNQTSYTHITNTTTENSIIENLEWVVDSPPEYFCDPSRHFIIAIVTTAPENFSRRKVIRNTWANPDFRNFTGIKAVFMLGHTDNVVIQKKIDYEADSYKDIIQTSYQDNYRNLTYKTVAGLMWTQEWCPQIPFVLKIDDDVMMNPFRLAKYLEKTLMENSTATSYIYGKLFPKAPPLRSGKWNVSEEEYNQEFYPPFVLGPAYIIGMNAVDRLLAHTSEAHFMWLEDVFLTGIVAKKADVHHVNIGYHFSFKRQYLYSKKRTHIFMHKVRERSFLTTWKLILKYNPEARNLQKSAQTHVARISVR